MTQAPNPNDKPSPGDQIADIILRVVKPGGITCGGIGAVWFLLAESDIPRALASGVIGVMISYGAKLLQPIHEGNLQRFENAGNALEQGFQTIIRYVIGKISGGTVEDRYLQCQAMECRRVRSEGMVQHGGIFIPLLEEVFVPLALDASAQLPGFAKGLENCELEPDLLAGRGYSIWRLLKQAERHPNFRQIVILAWGGYGKTTLLKHIAYIYGCSKQKQFGVPKRIPVLLVLRKYRDVLSATNPPDLPELIVTHHIPDLPDGEVVQASEDWITQVLRSGKAVVMFDGFDEVAKTQRPAVASWINRQMRQYSKSIFIVTSRPKAYREQPPGDRLELATPLWVQDFNVEQRREFVERWYLCQERYNSGGDDTPDVRATAKRAATELLSQIEARQELKDLAKNPLLLNMIVTFHRRYPGADLPKRRVELYREICQLQLRDRPKARTLDTMLVETDARTILQMLALDMMQNRQERIERKPLLKQLRSYLTSQNEAIHPDDFLTEVVQVSELLVEREPDEFEFAHLSFQEYLAAAKLVSQPPDLLLNSLEDDWWKPTILLYIAQLKNPTPFIWEVYRRGAQDFAYICLQETTKCIDPDLVTELEILKQIDSATVAQLETLRQAVKSSRYQTLETLLKAQKWKEADKETYRLMITAVGKEEGQWFDDEELLNFPCEDLLAIDGLWVKYSNGLFGFSVQKQIYVACGAEPNGEYPDDKIWEEFCDRVGWRKDGKYLSYSDLNPSLSSPQGNFPFCGGENGRYGWVFVVPLLSHRDL